MSTVMLLLLLAVCLCDVIGVRMSWRGLSQPVPSWLVVAPNGH